MEWLAGVIASSIANWSMGAPKTPLSAADMMPSLKRFRRGNRKLSRKQIADNVRAAIRAHMATKNQ